MVQSDAAWREELEAAWLDIEEWYAERGASHLLLPGANPADLERAEARLGVPFPDVLRASLRRHNGTPADAWATGTLLGCGRIVAATELWRRIAHHGDGVPREFAAADARNGLMKSGWWRRGWIAIDEDGLGNGTAVDTEPGPQGHSGQVLDMDHAAGPSLRSADVLEYLREAADTLEDLRVVDGDWLDENDVWEGDDDDLDDDVADFDTSLHVERGPDSTPR